MTALTVATVASVAAAYACFGIVCYLAFGDEVNVIASQSLPSTPWPGGAVRGVYVVVVLLTFPLQLFPVTDMFDASGERPRAAAASRVGLVFFLAALAVAFEHKLDHVVSLLGALACAPRGLSATTATGRRRRRRAGSSRTPSTRPRARGPRPRSSGRGSRRPRPRRPRAGPRSSSASRSGAR